MITEISDDLIAQLGTVDGIQTVAPWAGEVEGLVAKPHPMPSLHLIYGGARFGEKETIGDDIAPHAMVWSIILMAKNLRSKEDGALACYGYIEAVRAALIGYRVLTYGWLWPAEEAFISAEKNVLIYSLDYVLEAET